MKLNQETEIHKIGLHWWKKTYLKGIESDGVIDAISSALCDGYETTNNPLMVQWDGARGGYQANRALTFSCAADAMWVHGGCRILQTEAAFASSMAATSISSESVGDMVVPWPSFLVRLPPGVFVTPDGEELVAAKFAQFHVRLDGEYQPYYYYGVVGERGTMFWGYDRGTVADMLFLDCVGGSEPSPLTFEPSDHENLVIKLIKRAVVGLLYTLQHTRNFTERTEFKSSSRTGRHGPPRHRTIFIGRPLSIDCTSAVRQACIGGGTPPSVQTLVRGHIKRQVVGAGGSARKLIWIEPYWRGPEDAPILSRPIRVGNGAST